MAHRRDPDDCLAPPSLSMAKGLTLVGVSTVYGNAALAETDGVMRALVWLEFWRRQVGLAGFYPFDLMAAAYLREPSNFRCARVQARVGDDPPLGWFSGGPALLVSQDPPLPSADGAGTALYCDRVILRLGSLFE